MHKQSKKYLHDLISEHVEHANMPPSLFRVMYEVTPPENIVIMDGTHRLEFLLVCLSEILVFLRQKVES